MDEQSGDAAVKQVVEDAGVEKETREARLAQKNHQSKHGPYDRRFSTLAEAVKCYSRTSRTPRVSLQRTAPTNTYGCNDLGLHFPFKGRQAEARQIVDTLLKQKQVRDNAGKVRSEEQQKGTSGNSAVNIDVSRRNIDVPVARGLSGCGKTTLFRECIRVAGTSTCSNDSLCDACDECDGISINRRCNLRIGRFGCLVSCFT